MMKYYICTVNKSGSVVIKLRRFMPLPSWVMYVLLVLMLSIFAMVTIDFLKTLNGTIKTIFVDARKDYLMVYDVVDQDEQNNIVSADTITLKLDDRITLDLKHHNDGMIENYNPIALKLDRISKIDHGNHIISYEETLNQRAHKSVMLF